MPATPAGLTFADLGLAAPLLKALQTEGYVTPTPIQAQAIPSVLMAKDLLGIAQTGTGKTAAFALPILHRLAADKRPAPRKGCRVLVLSPTRELATQIADSFKSYGRHMGVSVAVIFGGVGYRPQIQALARGLDILVATPGRLIDHMDQKTADISGTEIFVLDEADQMLDLGFLKPIRKIVARLVTRRQNLFFSATMPDEIGKLAGELLKDPVRVAVTPVAKTADRVSQKVIHVPAQAKRHFLTAMLADPDMERTLVFTRTKRGADKVAEHLEKNGIAAAAIHGNKSQSQRERALDWFKNSKIRVMVATDIAARGIDVSGVSHVVNFELPEVAEAYVHRIGRTARAGAEGQAISLVDSEERGLLRDIERLIKQTIPAETRGDIVVPESELTAKEVRRPQRGRQQARPQGGASQPSRSQQPRGRDSRHSSGGESGQRQHFQMPREFPQAEARQQESRQQGVRTTENHHGEQRNGEARSNIQPRQNAPRPHGARSDGAGRSDATANHWKRKGGNRSDSSGGRSSQSRQS
ncbi:MAG: DEAD/DEAH box helicase [Beijerinckiaceae bacterium]